MMLAVCFMAGVPMNVEAAPNIKVVIDGKEVVFTDQKPYINADSRTMVPVRAPMEAIGCTVEWDGDKRQAIISSGETVAVFTIGSKNYTVNGVVKTMDTEPVIVNDRTAFPIRFCAEVFGAKVGWDPVTYTVSITTDKVVVKPPQQGDNIVQATPEQVAQIKGTYSDQFWTAMKMIGGKGTKSFYEMTEVEKTAAFNLVATGIIKPSWVFVTDKDLTYRSGENLYYVTGYLTIDEQGLEKVVDANVIGKYLNGEYSDVKIRMYDLNTGEEILGQKLQ